ncbi:Ubiquitin carboxyl-terminal hydrolase isozyme L3, partial [Clydaea vesicula]
LLHAILNGLDESDIDNGNRPLLKIFNKTRHFSADERAKFLESEEASELANLHFHSSIEGQSTVPESNADVDLHFVTFVEVEGQLYELDGRKPFPINHGACINLLEDSVNGI